MNDFENRILEVLEAYKAAVYERNVDAFLSLYDPEGAGIRHLGDMVVRRRRSTGGVPIVQWFTSLGAERVKVTFDDVQVTVGQDLAVVSAIGTYAAISTEGKELRSMAESLYLGTQACRKHLEDRPRTHVDPNQFQRYEGYLSSRAGCLKSVSPPRRLTLPSSGPPSVSGFR